MTKQKLQSHKSTLEQTNLPSRRARAREHIANPNLALRVEGVTAGKKHLW